MKRFQLPAADTTGNNAPPSALSHSLLQSCRHNGLQFQLFAPLHYERNYAYPLLIWLHGPGLDEKQLPRIMPLISMRNYVAVAPRGPRIADSGHGFQWTACDADYFAAETSIFDSFDVARQRYHIAPQRVFLAGFGSSGTMACRVALKYPRRFAGVLSICGPFPLGQVPLLNLEEARHLPLFIACCRQSVAYPVARTCDELRLFHAAGMHVTMRQYPAGDELNQQILHDMDSWIMEQVTGVGESSAVDLTPHRDQDC